MEIWNEVVVSKTFRKFSIVDGYIYILVFKNCNTSFYAIKKVKICNCQPKKNFKIKKRILSLTQSSLKNP